MNSMEEVELVIKISEEDFEIMKHNISVNNPLCPLSQEKMVAIVANGTPIPKGHGRVIDESKIKKCGWNFIGHHAKTDAPTIIEADKESEE